MLSTYKIGFLVFTSICIYVANSAIADTNKIGSLSPDSNQMMNVQAQSMDDTSATPLYPKSLGLSSDALQIKSNITSKELNNAENVPLNTISPNTLKIFVKTLSLVRGNFVDPVNDDNLFFGAIDGMLKSIDPYAEFLDAQSYLNLQNFSQGELADIGVTLIYSDTYDNWIVHSITEDSPAMEIIETGDFVHKINGIKLVQEHTTSDVKHLLHGIAGSMVALKVSNKGRFERELKLQRIITKEALVSIDVKQSVAVVTIPIFQENTREQIVEALVNLDTPIVGLVLDIRNNPGGMLSAAADVVGLFAHNIDLVHLKYREGEPVALNTNNTPYQKSYLQGIPTIVLQNRYSASAAEVMASGLQSHNIATIVGEVSYGKGTVQTVIPLDDAQGIKLTIARYLSTSGKKINGIGIIPDVDFEIASAAHHAHGQHNQDSIENTWLALSIDTLITGLDKQSNEGNNALAVTTNVSNTSADTVKIITIDGNSINNHGSNAEIFINNAIPKTSTLQQAQSSNKSSINATTTGRKPYKFWQFSYPE